MGRPKGSKDKKRRSSDAQRRWGAKNSKWKGNKVGRNALHEWIRRHKPKPALCQDCRRFKLLEIANISGKYKRDINDFKWICRKCHMFSDGRFVNLKNQEDKNAEVFEKEMDKRIMAQSGL